MNKKVFLLNDALINVLIVSLASVLCLGLYKVKDGSKKAEEEYHNRQYDAYIALFSKIGDCKPCVMEEDEEEDLYQ